MYCFGIILLPRVNTAIQHTIACIVLHASAYFSTGYNAGMKNSASRTPNPSSSPYHPLGNHFARAAREDAGHREASALRGGKISFDLGRSMWFSGYYANVFQSAGEGGFAVWI